MVSKWYADIGNTVINLDNLGTILNKNVSLSNLISFLATMLRYRHVLAKCQRIVNDEKLSEAKFRKYRKFKITESV